LRRALSLLIAAGFFVFVFGCASKNTNDAPGNANISKTTPIVRERPKVEENKLTIPKERVKEEDTKKIIGFQVLLFSSKTVEGLTKEMAKIKETGANTVIVRVFHNRHDRFYPFINPATDSGVYFNTTHSPVVGDALTPMIEAARANDLSIFAWMTTKYAVYGQGENNLYSYDFKRKEIVPSFGVDLFDDREVARLVNIYKDLAKYDIDGVLFQDDLILRHAEGMGNNASKLYGKTISPNSLYVSPYLNAAGTKYYVREYTDEFWKWSAFKSRRLGIVAKRIMAETRKVKPDIKFGVNLSYESTSRPNLALAWLSQDIGEFKADRNSPGADYFFIMAYHRQMMREKSFKTIGQVAPLMLEIMNNALFVVGKPERLVIKLQVTDWKTGRPVADGELLVVASYLSRLDEISIAFVPFRKDAPLKDVREIVRKSER
jgi:poly-beta-1,6-N-acetyl-D-glucosamine N-deacetylase